MENKIGLVLEGGASRTVFSCGVMDALLEAKITADYVIGTSAGISYGVSYCSGQRERNLRITTDYMDDRRYMGTGHLLDRKNKSYYNLDFVFSTIPNKLIPFDYKAFAAFRGQVISVVTGLKGGTVRYLDVPRDDKSFMALRASCALPILFKPIEIDGDLYMDGGICDSIPFGKAFEDGCDKCIVVLTRPRGYVKKQESAAMLVKALYRKYPEFVAALLDRPRRYNESLKRLYELEKAGKVFVIAPSDTMGIGRTEKRPERLVPLYNEGLSETRELIGGLKSFIGG